MAQFPCDHCGARYRGPQQTAYPAIVNGTSGERMKRRVCPSCLLSLSGWMQDRLVPGDSPDAVTLCSACGSPDPELAIFVTVYRTGMEREDWFGRLHEGECRAQARLTLFGSAVAP
jgi:hypothetical protein